jgi:hypothetical protein
MESELDSSMHTFVELAATRANMQWVIS